VEGIQTGSIAVSGHCPNGIYPELAPPTPTIAGREAALEVRVQAAIQAQMNAALLDAKGEGVTQTSIIPTPEEPIPCTDSEPKTKYFSSGFRLDISGGIGSGMDLNFEYHCTIKGGGLGFGFMPQLKCGWFAGVGIQVQPDIGGGVNIGAIVGRISFPDTPGATSFVYAAGIDADVGSLVGVEADVTMSLDKEFVVFLGGGPGASRLPGSPYGLVGASVYLGSNLDNVPEEAMEQLWYVIELLGKQADEMMGAQPAE
jgi:hypothetical protein